MIAKKLIQIILNNYEVSENEIDNYLYKSINRYLLFLILIYGFYFVDITYSLGFTLISVNHLMMIAVLVVSLILKKEKYIFNISLSIYKVIFYVILLLSITFLSIYTNFLIKIDYFYFPIVGSVPFIFSFEKERNYILFVIAFTVFMVSIPFIFDMKFMPKISLEQKMDVGSSIVMNFLSSIIGLFINLYFIYSKDQYFFQIKSEKEKLSYHYSLLEEKYNDLINNQFMINNITLESIDELYELAETNSPLYFEKFCFLFPSFKTSLESIDSELTYNDFFFCSLCKLNFGTKKLATILDVSVRSIESRKYRLNKRLNLLNQVSFQEFIIKI